MGDSVFPQKKEELYIIKRIVLVGDGGREVIKKWEGRTSKRSRFFRGLERENGLLKAGVQIETGFKHERVDFDFIFVSSVEDAIKMSSDLPERKKDIMIMLTEDQERKEKILQGKTAGRYHYTPCGWVVLLKSKINEKDINEVTAKFFNENLLWSNKDPDEVDRCLWNAAMRYKHSF